MGLVTRRNEELEQLFNKFVVDPKERAHKPNHQNKSAKEQPQQRKNPKVEKSS